VGFFIFSHKFLCIFKLALANLNENDYHYLSFNESIFMKHIFTIILLLSSLTAIANEEYNIQIINHRFEPAELTIPAGKKVKLIVENKDSTPEEFESHELNREKVIAGNGKATIYIGPLSPGKYPFFGEFNEATAQGNIVAK
jgi:plastocyanin